MKTIIKKSLFNLALFALFFTSTELSAQIHWKLKFVNEFTFMFLGNFEIKPYEVSNIPSYIRYLPIHPEDSMWADNNDTIESRTLHANEIIILPLCLRSGFTLRKQWFEISAGGSLGLKTIHFPSNYEKDKILTRVERNYTWNPGTNQRGYGAALTYYSLSTRLDIEGGCFIRIVIIKPSHSGEEEYDFFIEGSLQFSRLSLENGYDRYNRLKKINKFIYGNAKEYSTILGVDIILLEENKRNILFKIKGFKQRFYVGMTCMQFTPNALGKELTLKNNSPYLTFGYLFEFMF